MPESADRRTALAEDRTVLAAERTFAAWLRTGLGFLASALAAERLLGHDMARWSLRSGCSVLVLCALASFAGAAIRDRGIRRRLPQAEIRMLPRLITAGLPAVLCLVSLPVLGLIWRS